jgi:hypothetical protein
MKRSKVNRTNSAKDSSTEKDHRNDGKNEALSPAIRQLILSFHSVDPDQTWDASAYTRRAISAAH